MRNEYEDQDVQEILRRAVRVQSRRDSSRANLLMSAQELGISDEALAQAEVEYLREKTQTEELREFMSERRRGYLEHLVTYVAVNAFLITINLVNWSGHLWAIYPLLGWGIGIAIHTFEAFSRNSADFEKDFARWKRRRAKRAETPDEQGEDVPDFVGIHLHVGRQKGSPPAEED